MFIVYITQIMCRCWYFTLWIHLSIPTLPPARRPPPWRHLWPRRDAGSMASVPRRTMRFRENNLDFSWFYRTSEKTTWILRQLGFFCRTSRKQLWFSPTKMRIHLGFCLSYGKKNGVKRQTVQRRGWSNPHAPSLAACLETVAARDRSCGDCRETSLVSKKWEVN